MFRIMEAIWRYFKILDTSKHTFVIHTSSDDVCAPSVVEFKTIGNSLKLSLERNVIDCVVRVQLPGYLKSLPLPKNLAGFAALNRAEWLELLPFFIFLLILLYLVFSPFLNFVSRPKQPRPRINKKQRKDEPKVADKFDIEDLGDKVSFCRCWKSNKFPYCDGTHNTHNKETGDNVGPVTLCKKDKKKD